MELHIARARRLACGHPGGVERVAQPRSLVRDEAAYLPCTRSRSAVVFVGVGTEDIRGRCVGVIESTEFQQAHCPSRLDIISR
jgi:hypothetical protein